MVVQDCQGLPLLESKHPYPVYGCRVHPKVQHSMQLVLQPCLPMLNNTNINKPDVGMLYNDDDAIMCAVERVIPAIPASRRKYLAVIPDGNICNSSIFQLHTVLLLQLTLYKYYRTTSLYYAP